MKIVILALAALAACVSSDAVTCSDGKLCPAGTKCVALTNPNPLASTPNPEFCATPQQLTVCDGIADGTMCTDGTGTCYGGFCISPPGCGNGWLDPKEACDDGNQTSGDGCSADCKSLEVCGNGITDLATGEVCDDGNHIQHDACSSACKPEVPLWHPLDPRPVQRDGAAMAFDSHRNRIVVFGGGIAFGFSQRIQYSDTWEWNGRYWRQAFSDTSPLARSSAAMAYDSNRKVMVLFGGAADLVHYNDTWEWDGATWRLADPAASPPARQGHAMAYDPVRKQVVMYGGYRVDNFNNPPVYFDDTWGWDGTQWTPITGSAPPARTGHAMAYDPTAAAIVMFGGQLEAGGIVDETWTLSASGWSQLHPSTAPSPRALHAMASDPTGGHVMLVGGTQQAFTYPCGGQCTGRTDAWKWNGTTWVATTGAPAAIAEAPAAPSPLDARVMVFGNDGITYAWTGTWTTVDDPTTSVSPGARSGTSFAADMEGHRIMMVGGKDTAGQTLFESWLWDGHAWSSVSPPLDPRALASMAYDEANHEFVMFGGENASSSPLNDTWIYHSSWTQALVTGPSGRFGAATAYDRTRQETIIFGGTSDGNTTFFADTWRWKSGAWTQVATTGPSARFGACAGYDPIRAQVVLFGGASSDASVNIKSYNDTWTWNGSTWSQATGIGQPPPPRFGCSLVWDAGRQRLVLAGGTGGLLDTGGVIGQAMGDAWEWDGTSWAEIPVQNPLPRKWHVVFPDLDGAGVGIFGGLVDNSSSSYADTTIQRLRWDGPSVAETCTRADIDGDSLAGCADPDCWAVCTPLCPPGATCASGAAKCGDGTCDSPRETCDSCPSDCSVCVARCGDGFCDAPETAATCPGDCP